ncbi:MAG: CopD family protein, partial [Ilumatobacteraceae bacterium]
MRRLLFCLFAAAGAVSLGAAGAVSLGAAPALAEGTNTLESSSPAAGEVITVAPTQLQLRFVQPAGTAEQVAQMGLALTCSGRLVGLGTPQLGTDGLTVSAALTQVPPNGTCTVSWKLADASAGSFSFESQTQPTTTPAPGEPGQTTLPAGPDGTAVETAAPRLGGPVGLARLMAFLTVSALFGGLLFVRFVWVEGVEYSIAERYFRIVSLAATASVTLQVSLVTAAESGRGLGASFLPTSWFSLLDFNEGRTLLLRLVAVGALVYFSWIPARIFEPTNVPQSTAALVLLAVSFGFDRMTGRSLAIGVVMGIVHMAFVMLFVGAVAIIWRVVLYGPGEEDLVHALHGWHRIATPVSVVIIVSGAVQVWRLDGLSLVNSGHGRMVLLKVLVVGLLLFVSAAVRNWVAGRLRRAKVLNQRAVHVLKKPVGVELALSVLVLAFSSILMSMRPPYVVPRDKGPKEQYAVVRDMTGSDDFRVRLSITPGNVGANKMLVELFGPARIQNFTVSLVPANAAFNGFKVYVPITRPGAALLSEETGMKLLAPGEWSVTVEGTTTTGDLEPLRSTFIVADGVTVTTQPNADLAPPPPPRPPRGRQAPIPG